MCGVEESGGGGVKVWDVHSVCEGGGNIHVLGFYADHTSLVPRLLCVDKEKTAWYTLFAYAQFPQEF